MDKTPLTPQAIVDAAAPILGGLLASGRYLGRQCQRDAVSVSVTLARDLILEAEHLYGENAEPL